MRILSIGNFYNPSWDSSIPDEEHIASALEELGYKVTRHQREDNAQYINHPIHDNYDFILIAQWDGYPETLRGNGQELPFLAALKANYNAPVVYWAFDYQADGQEWHERLVSTADLYLSKRIADSKYPNWQWLSQDFSPSFLIPKRQGYMDIDVLFTGSYLPWATERNETLKAIDEKFNLIINSVNEWPGFKHQHGPVMDESLPELYGRAKVILSIDHTLEAGYWSDRNAQIIACGRKPLFRYIPLSETKFKDRVTYFYSVGDCLEKIEEQLKLPMFEERTEDLYVKDRVQDLLTIVRSIL